MGHCQPILEHQIRHYAPSSVISRPTYFFSSLRCCWSVDQHRLSGAVSPVPFIRRHCDCLASSAAKIRVLASDTINFWYCNPGTETRNYSLGTKNAQKLLRAYSTPSKHCKLIHQSTFPLLLLILAVNVQTSINWRL